MNTSLVASALIGTTTANYTISGNPLLIPSTPQPLELLNHSYIPSGQATSSPPTIASIVQQQKEKDRLIRIQQHLSHLNEFHHGAKGHYTQNKQQDEIGIDSMMIEKSPEGFYIFNNITLKQCRDVLKPIGVDKCALTDYIEDCVSEEGLIDYVAFFFCAFSPEKLPLALIISILWLLTLFVAIGVTATDFLCPSLFLISKTLGLSQNIAGVTFLALGNVSPDIFAAINGIRLGKPDLIISVIYGTGTMTVVMIVGCVFAIKDFRLDKLIFIRDSLFYAAAASLVFYIFVVPGKIRLRDSVCLLGLYVLYVIVVLASKVFTKDGPLKSLHGNDKKDSDEKGIQFEGAHVDDDPTASMVVMRRFLFYTEEPPQIKLPVCKVDKSFLSVDTIYENGLNPDNTVCSLTTQTNKSGRRVTLFEEDLFTGVNRLSLEDAAGRNRSASIMSISKQQLGNLRRASRDIRRQSMDFLTAVSPINLHAWKKQNWGGRTMELIKAPIRLFLLITTPMADVDGKDEWNKPLSILHCITGPIFFVFAFGFGSVELGPFTVPIWVIIIAVPVSLLIIFTSSSKSPPFYYNIYSSYLGFIVSVTWIYTISSEVINLLRAFGIAFSLSDEIMGLTILAWGNAMVDFITNVSIAKAGFPKMAMAACYGGPLMGTLVGIGLPSFVALVIDPDHKTTLGSSILLYIIYAFLMFGLFTTLVAVILLKFHVRRSLGIYLVVLYIVLIITEWSTELKLFNLTSVLNI